MKSAEKLCGDLRVDTLEEYNCHLFQEKHICGRKLRGSEFQSIGPLQGCLNVLPLLSRLCVFGDHYHDIGHHIDGI